MIQPNWKSLSSADGDIQIKSGNLYAVVVSTSNKKEDLLAQAANRGLTVFDYGESTVDSNGYRQIHAMAQATADGGSIPWSPSFPASLVAHYQIQKAWWAPPPSGVVTPSDVVSPTVAATSNTPLIALGVVAAAAIVTAVVFRRKLFM